MLKWRKKNNTTPSLSWSLELIIYQHSHYGPAAGFNQIVCAAFLGNSNGNGSGMSLFSLDCNYLMLFCQLRLEKIVSRSATVLCYCSLPGLLWLWGLEFLLCLFCHFFLYISSVSRGLWLKHPLVKLCLMKNVEEDKEDHPLCVGPVKIKTLN